MPPKWGVDSSGHAISMKADSWSTNFAKKIVTFVAASRYFRLLIHPNSHLLIRYVSA